MRQIVLVACSVVLLLGAVSARRQAEAPRPKLVLIVMIDQMRADYVDRFSADWTGGFKRLLAEGARFRRAAYPYLTTVTCPGHATVSTGAFPSRHGVFQNVWYDRERRRQVTCTEDPAVRPLAYSGEARGGDSAARLLVPSLADELRRQRRARVVSLALKPRSAIMLAGHGGTAVTWLNDFPGAWTTSTAYTPALVPEVAAFIDENPIHDDVGKTWARILPLDRYRTPDAGEGEAPPRGWTAEFPHRLAGDSGQADATFRTQWERSPFADAYLGRFAAALAEAFRLGGGDGTDVLAVSFSSPDLVGHAFGPTSQEVQDHYAHLDRTLGRLLDRLDALVGRQQYVVALSADHGVSIIPEQTQREGRGGGRLSSSELTQFAERRAQGLLGSGPFIARVSGNDVYFEPGMYDRLRATPRALDGVVEALAAHPGVARVFTREALAGGGSSSDPQLRAAALSYVARLSGDLVLALEAGWMFSTSGTTHGTANPDDQRVPLLLAGPGVRPGLYDEEVTPADIAPTLAALTGIALPGADGRVLSSALLSR